MTFSTSLTDNMAPLVLDTSVLINLHASKSGGSILSALSNEIVVPEVVATELEHETSKKNGEYQFIQELIAAQNVTLATLDEEEYTVFHSLVSGHPSLDDGEAATIAIAACRKWHPIIDERKGRHQAQVYVPDKQPGWSLDLFCHPDVKAKLGVEESINAIFLALRDGRMRIQESHCDHVVRLIGLHRALECTSLPGYKLRREQWKELIR